MWEADVMEVLGPLVIGSPLELDLPHDGLLRKV